MKTHALAIVLAFAAVLPAAAQEPEKVAPGIVSLEGRHETFPAIDPVDGSLWFSVYDQAFDKQTIMRAPSAGASWSAAEKVAFSTGEFGDRAPRFSPDGKRLYFTSNRPVPGHKTGDLNIWVVDRQGSGWSAPVLVPAPVSTADRDMHNVVLTDGTIFLSSYRAGGAGRADIWRVPLKGQPTNLGAVINSPRGETDLYVSPDGRWMILVVTDHAQGLGGDDLFVSEFKNGAWSALRHLPAPINSAEYEYGPSISPDGKWLYFTSHRSGGNADVYRVELARVRN